MESTKNPTINARHPNIFSHTRECVAFAFDYGKCVVYTQMSPACKSTLSRKRNTLKMKMKCTQCSTSACLAIQTTMNRMESANFLMMNLVHRNLQPFRVSLRVLIHGNFENRRESTPLRLLRNVRRSVISLLFTRMTTTTPWNCEDVKKSIT